MSEILILIDHTFISKEARCWTKWHLTYFSTTWQFLCPYTYLPWHNKNYRHVLTHSSARNCASFSSRSGWPPLDAFRRSLLQTVHSLSVPYELSPLLATMTLNWTSLDDSPVFNRISNDSCPVEKRIQINYEISSTETETKHHRPPRLTSREKAKINSWTRHALCDSVLSYERNRWKFKHVIRNSMANEIWSIYNDKYC